MPKAKPLHSKGKVTSIQKPHNNHPYDYEVDPEEAMRQFQLELVWCIQQLEKILSEKKGTEKQLQETWKVVAVLKNNNQPTVRKRQLMRTHLGDYRAMMQAEERKLAKMASKMKISETPAKPKATFLRKSAFLTTGNEAFRFNFNISQSETNGADTTANKSNISSDNVESATGNNDSKDVSKHVPTSSDNAKSDTGNTNSKDGSKDVPISSDNAKSDTGNTDSKDGSKDVPISSDNAKSDTGNTDSKDGSKDVPISSDNAKSDTGNTDSKDGSKDVPISIDNAKSDTGNTDSKDGSKDVPISIYNAKSATGNTKSLDPTEDSEERPLIRKFKFNFSNPEFKFNF